MNEAEALMALARAQKAMLVLTKQTLRRDQTDGLRAAAETKEHADVYWKFRDRWVSQGLIDSDEAEAADKVAGFNT